MPPKDVSALQFRIVRAGEVGSTNSPGRKQLQITQLAQRFIDPETNEPIKVGEAIEIGEWDTENEGLTWLRYYMPDAYKELGWGQNKKNKSQRVVSYEPRPRDGKVYFWVVRLL